MFCFVHKNTSELIKIKPGPFITKEKQVASVDKKTWSKIKKRKKAKSWLLCRIHELKNSKELSRACIFINL